VKYKNKQNNTKVVVEEEDFFKNEKKGVKVN